MVFLSFLELKKKELYKKLLLNKSTSGESYPLALSFISMSSSVRYETI